MVQAVRNAGAEPGWARDQQPKYPSQTATQSLNLLSSHLHTAIPPQRRRAQSIHESIIVLRKQRIIQQCKIVYSHFLGRLGPGSDTVMVTRLESQDSTEHHRSSSSTTRTIRSNLLEPATPGYLSLSSNARQSLTYSDDPRGSRKLRQAPKAKPRYAAAQSCWIAVSAWNNKIGNRPKRQRQ